MKARYIYHSCFLLEDDETILVFDYWKDPLGELHRILQETAKQIYVFVSHFHEDHYNPEVLEWGKEQFPTAKPVRLFVSYDTAKRRRIGKEQILDVMMPGKFFEDEYLKASYYRSTDIGVSVAVTMADGTTIFHAGDLNNWFFDSGEGLKVSLDEMEGMYLSVIRELMASLPRINHAMIPFDPRLEENMLRGPMQFLNKIYVDNMYPMHFWHRHRLMGEVLAQLQQLFPTTTFWYPMAVTDNQNEKI
jgi:hypothetical protein